MQTHEKRRPAGNGAASTTTPGSHHYIAETHRRRASTKRVPPYGYCTCRDPWVCRCADNTEPPERYVDGYRDAVLYLLSCGLTPAPFIPEMRAMYRRRGTDARLAMRIAERWQAAA
jgi:hypothetical protein